VVTPSWERAACVRAHDKTARPSTKGQRQDSLLKKSVPEALICEPGPLKVGIEYREAALKTGSLMAFIKASRAA
jgi:hypothetical protein